VGVWFETPSVPIDREVLALLRNAADRLADAGARVEDAHPPVDFDAQRDLFFTMISGAISPSLTDDIADTVSGTHRGWLRADDERARLAAQWAAWFEQYDALLCPVLPVPAFPHQQSESFLERTLPINGVQQPHAVLVGWPGLIGIVDLPSAVAPIGRTAGGLPVGMQVVAPYLRDRDAIALCAAIAEASGGGYAVPPGF
jgi:amidase